MSKRPLFKASNSELIDKFHKVEDFPTLANLLEFNVYGLERIFYELRSSGKHYHKFSIKKRSGEERPILAPDYKLKIIQRRLAYVLSLIYLGRISVHGFRRGKSIITNAERHTHRRLLLNIDLENFFPTIHFGRVRGILQVSPYNLSRPGAIIIAGFCCHMGKLPQGGVYMAHVCSKCDNFIGQFFISDYILDYLNNDEAAIKRFEERRNKRIRRKRSV
jgi:RNA-directed DNA polymerase